MLSCTDIGQHLQWWVVTVSFILQGTTLYTEMVWTNLLSLFFSYKLHWPRCVQVKLDQCDLTCLFAIQDVFPRSLKRDNVLERNFFWFAASFFLPLNSFSRHSRSWHRLWKRKKEIANTLKTAAAERTELFILPLDSSCGTLRTIRSYGNPQLCSERQGGNRRPKVTRSTD